MASAARLRPLQKVELFHFQLPGTAFDDVLREIAIMRKVGRRPGARTLEPSS